MTTTQTTTNSTASQVRDMAYYMLKDNGIPPLEATREEWAMACAHARTVLAAQAEG